MKLLEFIFKDAIKDKKHATPVIAAKKTAGTGKTNFRRQSEIQAEKSEEELLNKIRTGIEAARMNKSKDPSSITSVIKLTKEGVMQLEEKMYAQRSENIRILGEDTSHDFYLQYTTGNFVVSL